MAENLENTTVETGADDNSETRTYTKEEVDKLLQQEGDRRISQYQKTLERKSKEAEKLKSMSDSEKYEYQLEQREKAIEQKEAEIALTEMKSTTISILAEKGLDVSLVDLVVDIDSEVTNSNIKKLEKAFKASVKAEVERRLGNGGVIPKKGTEQGPLTVEQFRKMSLSEKQKLYTTDRDTYNSMINS